VGFSYLMYSKVTIEKMCEFLSLQFKSFITSMSKGVFQFACFFFQILIEVIFCIQKNPAPMDFCVCETLHHFGDDIETTSKLNLHVFYG